MHIATALSDQERAAVYRLRYAVAVQEFAQVPPDADNASQTIKDESDDQAVHLVVKDEDETVGAVRLNISRAHIPGPLGTRFGIDLFSDLPGDSIAIASRLAIRQDFGQSQALELLFGEIYRILREARAKAIFCQCEPGLVALYEQLGFRRYAASYFDTAHGYQIPLVFLAEDLDWMARVRSPFLAAAQKYGGDTEIGAWFDRTFPSFAAPPNTRVMGEEAFWTYLSNRVSRQNISLFDGLEDSEARKFVKSGTLIKSYPGDRIVQEGDPAHDLYLILSGYADAVIDSDGRSSTVASISPGQVFGEIGLLGGFTRTADVIARTEVECLVLSEEFLMKSFERMPAVSIQVCLNLSKVLSERLRDTTANWIAAERSIIG